MFTESDSIARNRNHNPTLNIPKSGQESMDSPGRFRISTLPPSRSRLVVDDPGCSRRQKFALSCSNSLIPERLERGRKGGGRRWGVRGYARGRRRRRTWRYQSVLYESVYEVWYRRAPLAFSSAGSRRAMRDQPHPRLWYGVGEDREPGCPGRSRNKSHKRLVLIVRLRSSNFRAKRNFRNLEHIEYFS